MQQPEPETETNRAYRRTARRVTIPPSRRTQAPLIPPPVRGLDPRDVPLPIASEWILVPSQYEPRHNRRSFLFQYDVNINGLLTITNDKASIYVLGVTGETTDVATRYTYTLEEEAILSRGEIALNPLSSLLAATARRGRQDHPLPRSPTPPLPTPNSRIGNRVRREHYHNTAGSSNQRHPRTATVGRLFAGLDSDSETGDTNIYPETSTMRPN